MSTTTTVEFTSDDIIIELSNQGPIGQTGDKGDTGNGIESITLLSESGLTKTYRILYTDGDHFDFDVTDGSEGATGNGIESITLLSESGLQKTYRILYTNGDHFDYIVTDGAQGDPGNGVTSVEKIGETGLVDHYRMNFSDGDHYDYDVTNGADASDTWGSITGTLSDQTDLQTALDSKADIITRSASGSLVHIEDGAPRNVSALSVGIEPAQAGSGDPAPDNIRAISGHTQANVTRTGKNLLDPEEVELGKNYDGSTSTKRCILYKKYPYGTYTISVSSYGTFTEISVGAVSAKYNRNNGTKRTITAYNEKSFTFTISEQYPYLYFFGINATDVTLADVEAIELQLELGSTATAYEPYQGQSVTIALGSTVYGGTLDVLTGTMTVTHIGGRLGKAGWLKSTSYPGGYYHSLGSVPIDGNTYHCKVNGVLKCSHAKTVSNLSDYVYGTCYRDSSLNIRIMSESSTLSDWQDYLDNNNVQIFAELNTYQTVTLSPNQLSTLLGVNNIWSDAGSVSMTYRADTKMYVDKAVSEQANAIKLLLTPNVETGMKATRNYANGSVLIVGNTFLKTTAAVSNGSSLTVGTNCVVTTMAEWVSSLTA